MALVWRGLVLKPTLSLSDRRMLSLDHVCEYKNLLNIIYINQTYHAMMLPYEPSISGSKPKLL
jgi:hypothetical protein